MEKLEKRITELGRTLTEIDPNDLDVERCPSRIIKSNPNYLHGSYGRSGRTYLCELTGDECEYQGHLFKEVLFTKKFYCLKYALPLPIIESLLKIDDAKRVPAVKRFINRKRYIDYSIYLKLREKLIM